jgi:hypothetical protein
MYALTNKQMQMVCILKISGNTFSFFLLEHEAAPASRDRRRHAPAAACYDEDGKRAPWKRTLFL